MADYGGTSEMKVVNATQLDADLTSVANAIRTRGGTTEPMSFPNGMAEAVESIPDYMHLRISNQLTEYRNEQHTGYVYKGSFRYSSKLTSVYMPNVVGLNDEVFRECPALESIKLENVRALGGNVFYDCKALKKVELPSATYIAGNSFHMASALEALILASTTSLCQLAGTGAFNNTPIASGTGYIYVPSVMVDSYKAATNWTTFADRIRAIEDYPEITGGA